MTDIWYFDTSALVRRYDPMEPGASNVRSIFRRGSETVFLISTITTVEMASALNRKVRETRLTVAQRDRLWQLFRQHQRLQYSTLTISEPIVAHAERLVFQAPLRAYDAIQIATALSAARLIANLASSVHFCTADRNQAAAAQQGGLTVDLIA